MAPKSFSGQERTLIDQRLRAAAAECLERYGVRKTTVDELVRRAGIPKGTFYLFYPSKEALFFSLFIEYHNRIHQGFLVRLSQAGERIGWREFADALLSMCQVAADTFLLPLMTEGGLELILRKLPPELVAEHQQTDDGSVELLFAQLPQLAGKDPKAYSAALRGAAMFYMHRPEIGEEYFDDALKITVYGICRELFSEDLP